LVALSASPTTSALIESHLTRLQSEAKKAFASGQNEKARSQAQSALRFTSNPTIIRELREILTQTYNSLPAYKFPRFSLRPLGRQKPVIEETQTDPQSLHQLIADELFFLGLFDEAVPEFIAARSRASEQTQKGGGVEKAEPVGTTGLTDTDYSMAVYALRGGLANQAIRFAETVWKSVPSDYVLDLAPVEVLELLYPVPYRDSLLQHATPRKVDPRFVLAIARQESRFQADAKSAAAARGMMQFIPATANDTAKQLGRTSMSQDELYNPDTAILFGSQYLASLFEKFPGQPQAVASSYNGGPDNTARWVARSRSSDADRYVPEIGFSQTRDYVYKVMKNFWIYQQLYGPDLRRIQPQP
jgi:soluble lytic murein transglycosylase